jgi:lipopolysaccharide transport system ATP-binding protein
MAPIISVENLSKKYVLGHQQPEGSYSTMRDIIAERFRGIGRSIAKPFSTTNSAGPAKYEEEFWALKDVSFSIEQGERVGIIGRNGAGKSTLLKILSRITEPTSGKIGINGRVASLLEVGTGFHPELTGRENIFLNGAILGMGREEIKRKFDEIVAFSEVEKFLDTPVKRYSSGMYVRLAFAVAAHLEPEILIVDEVLAVGDAQFQKKCLGKMEDVGAEGRTILFVSHNMGAVSELCNRVVMLTRGTLATDGTTESVIEAYLSSLHCAEKREIIRSKCGRFELRMPYWVNRKGEPVSGYKWGEDYILRFEFNFFQPVPRINPGFSVRDMYGRRIFTSHLLDAPDFRFNSELSGKVVIDTDVNLPMIAPGTYEILFGVRDENEKNVLYSESELLLEVNAVGPAKNGADGILWHTSEWKQVV